MGNWIRNIEQHASENVNRILIGNKCDLVDKKVTFRSSYLMLIIIIHIDIGNSYSLSLMKLVQTYVYTPIYDPS